MFEYFLLGFLAFFAPIPWLISGIHLAVKSGYWSSPVVKFLLFGLTAIVWASLFWALEDSRLTLLTPQFSPYPLLGGLVLFFAVLIELLTMKALGFRRVFGDSELKQKKADKLISTGIYAYARHPRYLEHPFWFLGIGLFFGWHFFILFSLYLFLSFLVTAKIEEEELIQRYGRRYLAYRRKVPAFFVI